MAEWFVFAFINLLGAMSPGPDFAIVTRYGLSGSRKAALFATLGISIALLIHVGYCISGIGLFLQNSPKVFYFLQVVGASYLGYLGIFAIFSKKKSHQEPPRIGKAFQAGFFTNLFNPKATLFLLSLFTQFLGPDSSWTQKITFAVTIPFIAIGWFSLLSYFLTHPVFLKRLEQRQILFTRIMGLFLLLLALSMLWKIFRQI